MIALNKILEEKEFIEQKYKLMGKNVNISNIEKLGKIFKQLGIKTNEVRSNCNKLCKEIAFFINNEEKQKETFKQIETLNKLANKNTKKLEKLRLSIDKKLEKLPNIAIFDNELNITLSKNENSKDISNFTNYLKTTFITKQNNLKSNTNIVFNEKDLPVLFQNKNSLLLFTDKNYKSICDNLINQLKESAEMVIQKSIKQLRKESEVEYFATFKNNKFCEIRLLGEYLSRKYNIKYKDSTEDMTSFVNNILIKIKP